MWRVNNKLLKNSWAKEEIKGEIKTYIKIKENGNTSYLNYNLKFLFENGHNAMTFFKVLFILLQLSQFFIFPFLPLAQPATPQSIPTPSSRSKGHSDMFFDEYLPLLSTISLLPFLRKLSDCSLFTCFRFRFFFYLILFITFLLEVRSNENFGGTNKVVVREKCHHYR